MMRKTITIALLTLSLSLIAGCSSEEACEGTDCSPVSLERSSGDPAPVDCVEGCVQFELCDVMDAETCTAACRHDSFTREEMDCLARAACTEDGVNECFQNQSPDGRHRD